MEEKGGRRVDEVPWEAFRENTSVVKRCSDSLGDGQTKWPTHL